MKGHKALIKPLAALLTIAALGYLAHAVARDWRALDLSALHPRAALVVASVVLEGLMLAIGVLLWGRLIRVMGSARVPFRLLLRVWWSASVARFVPGKVWPFLAAAGGSALTGVSGAMLATSFGVHAALSLFAAGIVGVMLASSRGLTTGIAFSAGALLLGIVLVHPRIALAVARLAERLTRREPRAWDYRWGDGALLLLLHTLAWVGQGLAFALFVHGIVGIRGPDVPPVVGVTALSFAGGSLLSLAPAGLGVREAALVLLLQPYVPAGTASAVALAARLWTVAAELSLGMVALLLVRKTPP